MKILLTTVVFVISFQLSAQSNSFQALRDHFGDRPEVESYSLNGFLCRAAMSLVLPEEDRMRRVVKDIRSVRFIVIPTEEFQKQGLTVKGFRSLLKKDAFEMMADIRDKGDHVTIYHRTDGNKKDRYFVLVEEQREVVAIEMKGYIDPEIFKDEDNRISIR